MLKYLHRMLKGSMPYRKRINRPSTLMWKNVYADNRKRINRPSTLMWKNVYADKRRK